MTDAEVQQALQALSQLGAAAGNSKAGIQSVGQSMARLRMEMQRGTGTIQGNTQALQRLMTDFDGLDQATKRSNAGMAMMAEQTRMASQIMRDTAGQMSGAFVKGGVIEAIAFFKNTVFAAAESYQQGVSGTTAALRQQQVGLQSNIDILNRMSQGLAVTAEMLALIPSPASRIAAGLTATGSAVAQFFSETQKNQAEAYKLLGTELSATTIAYQTQAKAGNAFHEGMTEMRDTMNVMRLTTGEMTNVVTKNTAQLVQFGGSVQGGVVRLKSVNQELNGLSKNGQSLRDRLYRIGISYEDQSQGIIDYISLLQSSGQLQGKNTKDLAQESAKYMTNLKAISAFTGEDAKAAQARAQAASEQLAVQAKLRKSQDPAAFEKFQTMIKLMPADMQKGMQQMTAFDGAIVDKNLNILLAQSPTRKKVLDEAFADFQSGMYDSAQLQERQTARMKQYGKALEDEALAAGSSIGVANLATGTLPEVTTMLQDQAKLGQKAQGDLSNKIGTTIQQFERMGTQAIDPLTDKVMNLDTQFREMLAPQYNKAFTKAMTNMVTVGGQGPGGIKLPTLEQQNIDAMQKTLVALQGLGYLKDVPSLMQTLTTSSNQNTTTIQNTATALTSAGSTFQTASNTLSGAADRFGATVDRFGNIPRLAEGGIVSKPTLAMIGERGPEGVIPLGDGNNVNVAFKNPAGMLEKVAASGASSTGNMTEQIGGIFNSPNLMTTSLAELKTLMSADSQATQSLMKQYTDKMDVLIDAIGSSEDYLKRIADSMA